eukprot:926304-Rhodomonas_salina.3
MHMLPVRLSRCAYACSTWVAPCRPQYRTWPRVRIADSKTLVLGNENQIKGEVSPGHVLGRA